MKELSGKISRVRAMSKQLFLKLIYNFEAVLFIKSIIESSELITKWVVRLLLFFVIFNYIDGSFQSKRPIQPIFEAKAFLEKLQSCFLLILFGGHLWHRNIKVRNVVRIVSFRLRLNYRSRDLSQYFNRLVFELSKYVVGVIIHILL